MTLPDILANEAQARTSMPIEWCRLPTPTLLKDRLARITLHQYNDAITPTSDDYPSLYLMLLGQPNY